MSLAKLSVGDGIKTNPGSWEFSADVAGCFNKHVMKSVPFYLDTQALVVALSDWFVVQNSTIVDLGCATGTTISDLVRRHYGKNARYIGIDKSAPMIEQAHKTLDGYARVDLKTADIADFEYPKINLALCLYTLQFMNPDNRLALCQKIYNSLCRRGALILTEKVLDNDTVVADAYTQIYAGHKLNQGFTTEEIYGKTESLRGVLVPLTLEENIHLLHRAGFDRVSVFFKWCNFAGILAVKS